MGKRAFITGLTGQDGSYLAELLLQKGYEVHGLVRRSSRDPFVRIPRVKHDVGIHYGDLRDLGTLERVLKVVQADEIYNLAAQSDVGVSFMCPEETYEINYAGMGRLVHAALAIRPQTRIYQASTSEMFGATPPPQNELSALAPVSPYGEAKKKAHEDYVVGYRERHGAYICSGILFNHESPRRGEHFVTRKVTVSMAKIAAGLQDSFEIGNLEARRDWGFAGDYVEAMWMMLQQERPEDYVIGTGVAHSVREFIEAAGKALGMPITWEGAGLNEVGKDARGVVRVRVNKSFYRPREVHHLLADARKAKEVLGWEPRVPFDELVLMMTKADALLSRSLNPVAS